MGDLLRNNFTNVLKALSNSLSKHNTIYVLKGFNPWINMFDEEKFFLGEKPIEYDVSKKEIASLITTEDSKYMLYENLIYLANKNSLGGISDFTDYKIIIVENDYFDGYYPHFPDNTDYFLDRFADENDNLVQSYYDDIQISNGIPFVKYAYIYNLEFESMSLINTVDALDLNEDKAILMNNEIDSITFQEIVFEILTKNCGTIKVENENVAKNRIESLKSKFKNKIIFDLNEEINRDSVKTENYQQYVEILKRKNSDFDFFNIEVYKDPYESSELEEINQSVVIDRLVKNAILSQTEGERFRDIFVTAPTGAGKSIMFQIPAIYLAEKYDLVTIVISPLIGLMNDQVENIKKLTDKAATINSDYTPIEKEQVLESIKNGEKSILYISPETLLSNTDITNLIGERKIGLLVVDEAHIVATWGKSFRPDYWYLGEFISRLRKREKSNQNFPIATFTATATFNGDDNMYADIVESLKMTAERYIGKVKRDDLKFDIRHQEKVLDYQGEKLEVAVEQINKLQENNEKTLVYVPYTRHIHELYGKIDDSEKVGMYYGGMNPGEKRETLTQIISGEKNTVLATKAFGMGIDIDDIENVYHFAPTGNIPDYIQEIGRAARRPGMVGIARTDFYKEDFRYINQLFGMSSIKNWQIVAVLNKIIGLYRKNKKRNFLVSPSEFSYIFANEGDSSKVDAQLKTALLIIKKDFEISSSSNYIPLIFKPRSMFTNGYFMINDDFLDELKSANNFKFFSKINGIPKEYENVDNNGTSVKTEYAGDVYTLDFKNLWETNYKDMSFANFKRLFYNNELDKFNFQVKDKLIAKSIIEFSTEDKTLGEMTEELKMILNTVNDVFNDIRQSRKHFTIKQLSDSLNKQLSFKNTYTVDLLSQSIIYILNNVKISNFEQGKFATYNSQTEKWNIQNATYETRIKRIIGQAIKNFKPNEHRSIRYVTANKNNNNLTILLAQIVEILELARVDIRTGDSPEFFIRVNNPIAIDKVINDQNYKSKTVELVNEKHKDSVKLMEYFFMELSEDKERWNFIEKYFLGQLDIKKIGSENILKKRGRDDNDVSVKILKKTVFPYDSWKAASAIHPSSFYIDNDIEKPDHYDGEFSVDGKKYPYLYIWSKLGVIVFDSVEVNLSKEKIGRWHLVDENRISKKYFEENN